MSKDQRGPAPGGADPAPYGYGPGKTVIAQPAWVDPVVPAAGSAAIPPTTIHEPLPQAPPAHGGYGPPPGYGAYSGPPPPAYYAPQQLPYGMPPPPPQTSGRARRGPSMVVIAAVSAVVIGALATLVAIRFQPTGDDKPDLAIDVPEPASVSADPNDPPSDPAAASDAPPPLPSTNRPALIRPKPTPTARPGRPSGPGLGARPPPPRHGP